MSFAVSGNDVPGRLVTPVDDAEAMRLAFARDLRELLREDSEADCVEDFYDELGSQLFEAIRPALVLR